MANKTQRYRPSSGTEGAVFQEHYCDRCSKNTEEDNPCEIWMNTWIYELEDPEYPKEWIIDGNIPTCTSFKPIPPSKGVTNGE